MARSYSYLAFRDDETPVMLAYSYTAGSAPTPWGDYPDPGSPAEVEIVEAKDKLGKVVDLTAKEREQFEDEILEEHEEPSRDPDDERDERFERERVHAFWDAREEIDF